MARSTIVDCRGNPLTRVAGFLPYLLIESGETIDLISGTFAPVCETDQESSETKESEPCPNFSKTN